MTACVAEEQQYVDHFWGEKHQGYQVLYDNMKKSDDVVNEVTQFLKERLALEDEYVKNISRSTQKVASFINNGSNIEHIWILTKGTLELLSEIHLMMVRNLQDLTKDVQKYKDEAGKARKEMKQQNVAESVNLMQTTTTCLQKAKETYNLRCSELEKVLKETNLNQKEVNKIESKVVRAREEYKNYVEKYEQIRGDFEVKLNDACRHFQAFDRSLYASIQQFLLLYAGHVQEMMLASQQVSAQFRESLQQINVSDLLNKFIKQKATGTDRPQRVVFEENENESLKTKESAEFISRSVPSSCSSSGVVLTSEPQIDLLMMDNTVETSSQNNFIKPSPIQSIEDSAIGEKKTITATSVASAPTKKLSLFVPKRKKTISQSSFDETVEHSSHAGGLFKFSREKRRSKKSTDDVSNLRMSICADDAQSTASSSRSEDKTLNGPSIHPLDVPVEPSSQRLDDEGYVIREQQVQEDTNWSCSSSDEEDENELQQSRIRALTIRPVDKPVHMNASVDELRDAVGHISLTRSTTFDKDPWTIGGSRAPPLFSQSMSAASLRQPLRSHHTADGRFRTNFSESEYVESNVPPSFSMSMGPGMSMARARPRSNTPTHNQFSARKESTSSITDAWGSSFNMTASESTTSLGESTFNLSQSTGNLMQATISEQRIPVAMALNEFSHVWFKGANLEECAQRTFGTVMISFAASSLPLFLDAQLDLEPLQFFLFNTKSIKTVLPNKQLLDETLTTLEDDKRKFTFQKSKLVDWLKVQQSQRPTSSFFNAEVARYELSPSVPAQPPLLFTAYWKFEPEHTDIRIDYRLNTESSLIVPMLNVIFSTSINGTVDHVTSDPSASWNEETASLQWTVHEISRHGDVCGSLKARVHMKNSGSQVNLAMIERKPAQVFAQFQCHDTSISGVEVSLATSDIYHLSMVRKKVLAGKYFCDPELRK